MSRLRGLLANPGVGVGRADPTQSGTEFVPDWPVAVAQPEVAPDPDRGFEGESGPPTVIGVLQWTSGVLVDAGRGQGSWDFIDLNGWVNGDMSRVVPGIGHLDTTAADLQNAVEAELDCTVSLPPNTWAFARQDSRAWWTAPLLVVHRH